MKISRRQLSKTIERLLFESEEKEDNTVKLPENKKIAELCKKIVDENKTITLSKDPPSVEYEGEAVDPSVWQDCITISIDGDYKNMLILHKPKIKDPENMSNIDQTIANGAWAPAYANSDSGLGPLLYDIAMEIFPITPAQKGTISDDALSLWEKYLKSRPDVQKQELDLYFQPKTQQLEDDSVTEAYFFRWIKDFNERSSKKDQRVLRVKSLVNKYGSYDNFLQSGILFKVKACIKDIYENSNYKELKDSGLTTKKLLKYIEYEGSMKDLFPTGYSYMDLSRDSDYLKIIMTWEYILDEFSKEFHSNSKSPFRYSFKKINQEVIDYLYSNDCIDLDLYNYAKNESL